MKTTKIKRYRLGISRTFPQTHPKAGKSTHFISQIKYSTCQYLSLDGLKIGKCCENCKDEFDCAITKKLHTLRANYELWKKRMQEVQAGRAVIELFYWSGSPYNSKRDGSKQIVFAILDNNSGCGVQQLDWREMIQIESERAMLQNEKMYIPLIEKLSGALIIETLSRNDGLSIPDFKAWFKSYDLSKPIAIIHFTKFRY